MESCNPEKLLASIPGFEKGAQTTARSIHNQVVQWEGARYAADVLHGTWLEHPLHPALTDVVIGAWLFGTVLDGISLNMRRSKGIEQAADILISIGNAAAIPTALAGLADYSAIPKRAAATGAVHAILNAGGLVMNTVSAAYRSAGNRRPAMCLSAAAAGALLVSAWLGGRLTYKQKVGVNKIPDRKVGAEWKTAMSEEELKDNVPARTEVAGMPVMIYRSDTGTHAMCAVCAHEGGPLNQGEFAGDHVTCPWHQSVFDLCDGHVVHGPSTYPEPVYETRSMGGNVEIRSASGD